MPGTTYHMMWLPRFYSEIPSTVKYSTLYNNVLTVISHMWVPIEG